VILPNGLLSSLWVGYAKMIAIRFFFARKKTTYHVTFEQSQLFNFGRWRSTGLTLSEIHSAMLGMPREWRVSMIMFIRP
jgi:hypothetical protein